MKSRILINNRMSSHLQELTVNLSRFLKNVLSEFQNDWWEKLVINCLTPMQRTTLDQHNYKGIENLDLAALLRIYDFNWNEISNKLKLTYQTRHYLKELQSIRNRWSHIGSINYELDDIYRDADTILRFAMSIQVSNEFVHELKKTKDLIFEESRPTNQIGTTDSISSIPIVNAEVDFYPGQYVVLKSNPRNRGVVTSVVQSSPENRINVFLNNEPQVFYASQLQPEGVTQNKIEALSCDQFHSHLSALQIKSPGLSTLYSLNAARIDFIPYQFRPVLRFIKSDRPRLLIADSVGVGKTIEAGLILRELQARRDIRSVLIVCPRPLVTEKKWQKEMKRFDEQFTHLDGKALRNCINEMDLEGIWPDQHKKTIIPYSLFDDSLLNGDNQKSRKRFKGLLDLDPPPRFDMVIVDEAHHIRNSETYSHKAVRFFCDNAEAVVFLTATPIQLGSDDLYVLLNTLRPDLIIDKTSYDHMAEPNPHINKAVDEMRNQSKDWNLKAKKSLDDAASTPWGRNILSGSPDFIRIKSELNSNEVPHDKRVKMISDTEGLHTFANIINRTRRRDIGNFTIRTPRTVDIPFTVSQKNFHDELLRIQAEIFQRLHDGSNINFMMTTIRRQAASCLFGLVPFLSDILNRHIDELEWEEADNTQTLGTENLTSINDQIKTILNMAKNLDLEDPKIDELKKIIKDKQSLPNNKIMVFSSFRHTLGYLNNHLRLEGMRVGLVHGGTPDEERVHLRSRFELLKENKDSLDILLFSEIGCEGLDYQFCDCIVNYDLPWNPMRVEQRIGRIDRNGQKSEKVTIVNLITTGTVDADIYDKCLVRIGVFNNALGASEEILGEITRDIKNIAENFMLTEEDRKQKLQQLSDNKIRLVQEQENLEQRQAEFFGIHLPQDQLNREIDKSKSFWLSPTSLHRLVSYYLYRICGRDHEFLLGDKPLKTLRLSQDIRNKLYIDYQKLPKQNNTINRDWEYWLKGDNQHLSVTFEAECALQNPASSFLMPLHPLVRQAALSIDSSLQFWTNLSVKSTVVPEGKYKFAIYQWKFIGEREDIQIKPFSSNSTLTEHLSQLLEISTNSTEIINNNIIMEWDDLENEHYNLWNEARKKHCQNTKELVEFKKESLNISHNARIALLNDYLNLANDEKIQKMRKSQINTAESDYTRKIQNLDIALEKAEIVASPLAYGFIQITKG